LGASINSLVGDDRNRRGVNGHRTSRSLELGKYRKKIKGREDRSSRAFQLTPKIAISTGGSIYPVECKEKGVYVFVLARLELLGAGS
jgi:hypothetical protein